MTRLRTWHGLLLLACASVALGQTNLLPNPSFEKPDSGKPADWELSGDKKKGGKWEQTGRTGSASVSVTGNGEDHSYWLCKKVRLRRGRVYRFSFFAKTVGPQEGGCVISGADFANRDFRPGDKWERQTFMFAPPRKTKGAFMRVGHWHRKGTVMFDDVELTEATPVYQRKGDLVLGSGERVKGKRYTFVVPFGSVDGNYCRCLAEHTTGFNSSRWVYSGLDHVIYQHQVGKIAQTSGKAKVRIGWHEGGVCVVDASKDRRLWTEIGRIAEVKEDAFDLPADLFPAECIYLRLRSIKGDDKKAAALQVHAYTYEAELAADAGELVGGSRYIDVETTDMRLAVEIESLGAMKAGDNKLVLVADNKLGRPAAVAAVAKIFPEGNPLDETETRQEVQIDGLKQARIEIPYKLADKGEYKLRIVIGSDERTLYDATALIELK